MILTQPFLKHLETHSVRQYSTQSGALQFGWAQSGHTAIERASISLLAPSSFKKFLKSHLPAINQNSTCQDEDPKKKGPAHFTDVELLNSKDPRPLFMPTMPAFDQVCQQFSAKNQEKFKRSSISSTQLERFQNAYTSITHHYRKLVGFLRQVHTVSPNKPVQNKQALVDALEEAVGALSHYVGDLHQPLHNTLSYSWLLEYPSKRFPDVHKFLEIESLPENACQEWLSSEVPRLLKPKRGFNLAAIQKEMRRQIRNAYLKIFNLVAADQSARSVAIAPQNYLENLANSWKPIAFQQMSSATQNLAVILHSAYAEAGQPNLSALDS